MAKGMTALSPVRRMAIHTFVGALLFALIGGAAVSLHHAIVFIEHSGVPPVVIFTLHYVELLLFASDILTFVVFILLETYLFLRAILIAGVTHGSPVRSSDARPH